MLKLGVSIQCLVTPKAWAVLSAQKIIMRFNIFIIWKTVDCLALVCGTLFLIYIKDNYRFFLVPSFWLSCEESSYLEIWVLVWYKSQLSILHRSTTYLENLWVNLLELFVKQIVFILILSKVLSCVSYVLIWEHIIYQHLWSAIPLHFQD